jgi:hypothetical protein
METIERASPASADEAGPRSARNNGDGSDSSMPSSSSSTPARPAVAALKPRPRRREQGHPAQFRRATAIGSPMRKARSYEERGAAWPKPSAEDSQVLGSPSGALATATVASSGHELL